MVPPSIVEALDKDGGALNISASWLASECVLVVGKAPAHETILDPWEPVLRHCLLGIVDRVKHHKGIVAMLEQRSTVVKQLIRKGTNIFNTYLLMQI